MEIILQYIPLYVWEYIGMGVIALSALGVILKSIRKVLVACKKLAAMTSSLTDDAVLVRLIGWVDDVTWWADQASDFLGDLLRARPKTIGRILKTIPKIISQARA